MISHFHQFPSVSINFHKITQKIPPCPHVHQFYLKKLADIHGFPSRTGTIEELSLIPCWQTFTQKMPYLLVNRCEKSIWDILISICIYIHTSTIVFCQPVDVNLGLIDDLILK